MSSKPQTNAAQSPNLRGRDNGTAAALRWRLLGAGKDLIAQRGYEAVDIAAIARKAGVSEAELTTVFATKLELLNAIFDESWEPVILRVADTVMASLNVKEACLRILTTIMRILKHDEALAKLFLFESRRPRGKLGAIQIPRGYLAFREVLTRIAERGQRDGSFSKGLPPEAIVSALVGSVEGMCRDRMLTRLQYKREQFAETDVRETFSAILRGLAP